jgi:hypothetical protein
MYCIRQRIWQSHLGEGTQLTRACGVHEIHDLGIDSAEAGDRGNNDREERRESFEGSVVQLQVGGNRVGLLR